MKGFSKMASSGFFKNLTVEKRDSGPLWRPKVRSDSYFQDKLIIKIHDN